MVTIATSFSPTRIERQQYCLETWRSYGCEVIAVQSVGEAEILEPHFRSVKFVETDQVGDLFGRPKLVRITELIKLGRENPVLILNSDIHIQSMDFTKRWSEVVPKQMRIGIRWDIIGRFRANRMFKWGIDAFQITPELADFFPDIGLTMGCPVWDYWMVWYANEHGFSVKTDSKRGLYHEQHKQNWSKESYKRGFELVKEHHGIGEVFLTNYIQKITNRSHLKR